MAEKQLLKIKKLREEAVLPERKTPGSAGYDLCACIAGDFTIEPGELVILPTGLAAEIPEGCAGMIFTRSGLGVKHGIAVGNGVGVIDSDYRGEIHVGLRNNSQIAYTVSPGDRIAQLIVMPVCLPEVVEIEELSETERGAGGFGSTGI
ncbi:MAG: dUTP diphosphatase [Acutalibacter sp.]|nr:dUTP diphosphatase [Acutalibacter sp.]